MEPLVKGGKTQRDPGPTLLPDQAACGAASETSVGTCPPCCTVWGCWKPRLWRGHSELLFQVSWVSVPICSLSLSKPESRGARCQQCIPSLSATLAAACDICSASCVLVPLSLTWLEDIMGIWSMRSYGPREEEPRCCTAVTPWVPGG